MQQSDGRRGGVVIGMSTDALDVMSAYAATARWPAGFAVYQRGSAADGVFVVLQGSVVLRTRLRGGRAFVPRLVGPGEVFGGEGISTDAVYQTDARAETEAQTLHLNRHRLRTLMRERPAVAFALTAQLAAGHGLLLERLRELAMMSVEQRLHAAVERARARTPADVPDAPLVLDPAGYRLLCEMVGATRESVSLVINRLVAAGHAGRDGASVIIPMGTAPGKPVGTRSRRGKGRPTDGGQSASLAS